MDTHRWALIQDLFERASALPDCERGGFLNGECGGDLDLKNAVASLLPTLTKSAFDWSVPVGSLVTQAKEFATVKPVDLAGRNVRGYTLIREIGRGGMGAVYLAERSDGTFHRRAAIKLILPPAGSAQVVAWFQHEREILASLDHPNIARLLDAGVTEEGWPYFVMELVEGQPINRWCDERKLSVCQRLELFRGAIEAVGYAHRHLVVHRDLKPGNIFVTIDGSVKLLDFGIAKALSTTVEGKAPETVTLALVMTPEYASPEQVIGETVTTQSDIYSLGVVLYELLTCRKPYPLRGLTILQMARVITEVEPTPPSDVVVMPEPALDQNPYSIMPELDSGRLRQHLKGDLDAILLMALRKEPEQRYSSVAHFGEDLQRHLEHRPIFARRVTLWERLRRFQRRNPGGFTAGVLIGALFLSGIGSVAWQARHSVQAAEIDPKISAFLEPFWLFSLGLVLCFLWAAVYFSRVFHFSSATRASASDWQLISACAGGVVWGFGAIGRWWIERNNGWWHSKIAGHADPLMLISPLSFLTSAVLGSALLMILFNVARRFGWKVQLIALVLFGLNEPLRERIWFGKLIPALSYEPPNAVQALISAGISIIAGVVTMTVMRLTRVPDSSDRT